MWGGDRVPDQLGSEGGARMSRSFSYAMRRQCAVLNLVDTLATHIDPCFDGKTPAKTRKVCERINNRRKRIMADVFHIKLGEVAELGPQRHRQFERMTKAMVDVIHLYWPEQGEKAEVDAASILNAALVMAEDTRTQIPAGRNVRKDWDMLTGSLATLYSHIDPDLTDVTAMKVGLRVAETMEEAIRGKDIRRVLHKARVVEVAT